MCTFRTGKPLNGGAVGEVVESRAEEFKPGDAVTSNFGWREYFIASPKELHPVGREIQPLSVYLGTLGMTGMTAWVGLNLVEVKAGDVFSFREPRAPSETWPGNWRNCAGAVRSDRPDPRKRSSFS